MEVKVRNLCNQHPLRWACVCYVIKGAEVWPDTHGKLQIYQYRYRYRLLDDDWVEKHIIHFAFTFSQGTKYYQKCEPKYNKHNFAEWNIKYYEEQVLLSSLIYCSFVFSKPFQCSSDPHPQCRQSLPNKHQYTEQFQMCRHTSWCKVSHTAIRPLNVHTLHSNTLHAHS